MTYELCSSVFLMSLLKERFHAVVQGLVSCGDSNLPGSSGHMTGYHPSSPCFPAPSSQEQKRKSQSSSTQPGALGDSQQEVKDLKEQLEALRCQVGCSLFHSIKQCSHFDVKRAGLMSAHCCQGKICSELHTGLEGETHHQVVALCSSITCSQLSLKKKNCRSKDMVLTLALCHTDVFPLQTQIYEEEYETEHNDHKHTQQENRRLRKKREEMRQQVALLQEQVLL